MTRLPGDASTDQKFGCKKSSIRPGRNAAAARPCANELFEACTVPVRLHPLCTMNSVSACICMVETQGIYVSSCTLLVFTVPVPAESETLRLELASAIVRKVAVAKESTTC